MAKRAKKEKVPNQIGWGFFNDMQKDPREENGELKPVSIVFWFYLPNQGRPKNQEEVYKRRQYIMIAGHSDEERARALIEQERINFKATVDNLLAKEPVEFLPVPSDDASTPEKLKALLDSVAGKFRK